MSIFLSGNVGNSEECTMTIGERIRFFRKSHNYKQDYFANVLGISRTHISKIENNQDNPSERLIKSISALFEINYDWLKYGKGEMEKTGDNNYQLSDCIMNLKKCQDEHLESNHTIITASIMNSINFIDTMLKLSEAGIFQFTDVNMIFQELCKISDYWEKEYINNKETRLSYKDGKEMYEEIEGITEIYAKKLYRTIQLMLSELLASFDSLDKYFEYEMKDFD